MFIKHIVIIIFMMYVSHIIIPIPYVYRMLYVNLNKIKNC